MRTLTPSERAVFATARCALDAYIPTISATAATINDALPILRVWQPGIYGINDVRQFEGVPYKCVQAHDSTANPTWTPPAVPALWMQYHGTSAGTARLYLQPQGAHDAYQAGEYVTVDGKVYRCKIDNTVYPPSGLPGSWEAVGGVAEPTDPTDPEPTEPEPMPILPTAWDDFPANHLLAVGDEFSDKGTIYVVLREFSKQEGWRPPALIGNFYDVKETSS